MFLLGLADSTYSNQEEARYALYTEIVFPLLDTFQDSLNMWLTPRYGGYLGYDQDDGLNTGPDEQTVCASLPPAWREPD